MKSDVFHHLNELLCVKKFLMASGRSRTLSEEFKKIKHENAYLNDEKHPIFKNFDEAKLS